MIVIPCTVDSIRSLKDKSVKIGFETQELPPNKAGDLFSMQGAFGFMAFKLEPFNKKEIEMLEATEVDLDYSQGKSPSQRLRGVMYRLWEKNNEGYDDYNLFYIYKMEQICNHYKSKL